MSMLRFSANLSTMFQEVPLIERFAAAAQAGFKAVELWFPYDIPAENLAKELRRNDLVCVGINSPPGDVAKGDWGVAADPSRCAEFTAGVEQAMAYAQTIDCAVHVMAGVPAPGLQAADAWQIYRDNIARACDIAKRYGRQVLIEPLNAIDRPTYLLSRQSQAIEVIEALGRDNLRVMLDLFHVQRGEGNLTERMRQSLPYAGHVQIADVPGRHEPGTGEINYPFMFAELERLGYEGWIGCEYFPRASTVEGLGWMARATRRAD
jgi:hydroxypyruvate isomerase